MYESYFAGEETAGHHTRLILIVSSILDSSAMPALFTSKSMCPNCDTVALKDSENT